MRTVGAPYRVGWVVGWVVQVVAHSLLCSLGSLRGSLHHTDSGVFVCDIVI